MNENKPLIPSKTPEANKQSYLSSPITTIQAITEASDRGSLAKVNNSSMANSKHQHKNNNQDLTEMANTNKATSNTASSTNAAVSDNIASNSAQSATTPSALSMATSVNNETTNAEGDTNIDFSNLMAANILTEKRKSPFTPASKDEIANISDTARLMNNGTLMQKGHTVVQGIENRDPHKATFEHTTKVTHKISDAEREVVAQIYALNKTQKDKKTSKSKAKNNTAISVTKPTSTSTQSITTTPNVAANQQSIATGHTTIIGASNDFTNSSGAINALNRLRSTLSDDQQAYANQMQKQAIVSAENNAQEASSATSVSTKTPPKNDSAYTSTATDTVASSNSTPISHPESPFAANLNKTTASYSQNILGNEIGNAINSKVISDANLGNTLDERSLSSNGLANTNANHAVAMAKSTLQENRTFSSADFAGYPAMDPNDLPSHARRTLHQEPHSNINSFQTFDNDDNDLPAINLNRTNRSLPNAEEMPHYVVGNNGNNSAPQDHLGKSPLNMVANAVSAPSTANSASIAATEDNSIYDRTYDSQHHQQGTLSSNSVIPPEPSPVLHDTNNFDRIARSEPDSIAANAVATNAISNKAPAPTPDQTRMVLRNIPQTASDIDDDDLIYPGVFATKLKRQQKRILQEQEALTTNDSKFNTNGANSNFASSIDGRNGAEHNNNSLGMGDGLLTQVKISVDEAIDDQGPQYYVGPRKKILPPNDNNEPVYAIGVNLTNAEVEAKIQAERKWFNEANNIPNSLVSAINEGTELNDNNLDNGIDNDPNSATNADYTQSYSPYAENLNDEQNYNAAINGNQRENLAHQNINNSGNVRNAPLDASTQIPDLGTSTDDFAPAPQELFTSTFSGATRDEPAIPNDSNHIDANLNSLDMDASNNAVATTNVAYASNAAQNANAAVQQKERKLNHSKAKRQQAIKKQSQYNLTNMPVKEKVGLGMMIFLYLRQLIASFFSYTTLPSFMPRIAMHLGPSYPSSMAIPFFFVGLLSGLVGYAIRTSFLGLQHAGVIAFMIYTILIGLPAYRGIYRICTVILRKRHDMILMIAAVTIPLMIMMWMFNSILHSVTSIQEAGLLIGIASMLSAATASTMMWNFPQDPLDSCGRMSNMGLFFVILLCLLLSFGLLNHIVGISVLGVSIVMRLIFGYSIVKNQGTAQRPYIYALQQITLFAILLDLILLKGQGFPVLNSDNAIMLQNLVEGQLTIPMP